MMTNNDEALRFIKNHPYPFYLVDLSAMCIHSGWDYKSDAQDAVNKINEDKQVPAYSHVYRIWTRRYAVRNFIQGVN